MALKIAHGKTEIHTVGREWTLVLEGPGQISTNYSVRYCKADSKPSEDFEPRIVENGLGFYNTSTTDNVYVKSDFGVDIELTVYKN